MQSIIKKTAVQFTEVPAPLPAAGKAASSGAEPAVELLRRDGVVHGLQVTCGCGEVHVVELEYEPAAADAAPPAPSSAPPPAPTTASTPAPHPPEES